MAELIAGIAAAGISALAAILVARLRIENTTQHGTSVELLRSIDERTQRLEDRLVEHSERLARLEGPVP